MQRVNISKVFHIRRNRCILRHFFIFSILLAGFYPHHAGARQKPAPVKQKALPNLNNLNIQDKRLKGELEKYLGTRYMRGGSTRKGLDCSGFARLIYKNIFGVELPHNASSQYPWPLLTKIPERDLKTGDLLFFASTAKKKRINHVGIYLTDGKFIHAETKRGIVVSSLNEDHWRTRIVSGKRLTDQEMLEEFADEDSRDSFSYAAEEKPASRFNIRFDGGPLGYHRASFASLMDDSVNSEPDYIELDYSRPMIGDSWDLHLIPFRERLSLNSDDDAMERYINKKGALLAKYNDFVYSKGIKVATSIKPFQWLNITPSFICYNYEKEISTMDLPTRSLGVDVCLGSLDKRGWAVSTAFQYLSLKGVSTRLARARDELSALDMSLSYSQKLTDRLQLSLMGQRFMRSIVESADAFRAADKADQRVYFMLNFNY